MACRAAPRFGGKSAYVGYPEENDAGFDADPEGMPGLNEPMFLGDEDLDDEDVFGPPVRQALTVLVLVASSFMPLYFHYCWAASCSLPSRKP